MSKSVMISIRPKWCEKICNGERLLRSARPARSCPECGGVATVIHMYDTYDRADFGWDAGCGRYRAGDGIHTKKMKVSGLPSKEKAIEAWNRRADNG